MKAAFETFFATKTRAQLYRAALERKLMLAPVNDPAAILASEQLAARERVDVVYPHLGATIRHPGAVAKTRPEGARLRSRAPRIGEHNAEVYGEIGLGEAELAGLRREGVV